VRGEQRQIVILIAADEEWRIVKQALTPLAGPPMSPFGEWFAHELDIKGRRFSVIIFQTGCGKIPAAAAAQYVIQRWDPHLIVNLGTCGGFKGHVESGELLIVNRTVVYDIHERSGHKDEQTAKYTTDIDLSWLELPYPSNARFATMATADQDLDPGSISELYGKYGAIAADWESGAIAYVAHKTNGKACLILRGVSDVVDPVSGEPSSDDAIDKGMGILMNKLIATLPEWIEKATFPKS
jgi:adenosylhomocysteine nucleosidase